MRARPRASPDPEKLGTYRAKRNFSRTNEPSGSGSAASASDTPRFVVQRHRATRLHYDFRLEIEGVLVSWAVPKGPSLDPKVRRLAVRTEDHPLDYYDFEGVIPHGEYGGGDVIVWDAGTWTLHKDEDAGTAVAGGELHLELHGEKLRGHFMLIRRGSAGPSGGPKDQWLLFHKRDDDAVPGWDPEDHPLSIVSGRTNDDVAANPDAEWQVEAERALAGRPLRVPGATPDELAALDALGRAGTWQLGGIELELTNLDKVLAPGRRNGKPVTKRDLIRYHATIAPYLVPHLANRPVNMNRYPDGIDQPGFWNKAAPRHAPEWLTRWTNPAAGRGETTEYFVVDSAAALAWMANYGAIELHPWTSTTDHPDRPTYAMFDLDPGSTTTWADLLQLARLHRTAFDHLGVAAFPKVTGKRGIQIWVPVEQRYSFSETSAWAEAVSRAIGATVPDLVSWEWEKRARAGRARLDYTQNAVNKTLVVPYGVRPAPGAPVSAPITWDELDDGKLRPDRWTIRTVMGRIAESGDLWADIGASSQRLPTLDG